MSHSKDLGQVVGWGGQLQAGCSAVSNGANGSTVSYWNDGGPRGEKLVCINGFYRCETKRHLKNKKLKENLSESG